MQRSFYWKGKRATGFMVEWPAVMGGVDGGLLEGVLLGEGVAERGEGMVREQFGEREGQRACVGVLIKGRNSSK